MKRISLVVLSMGLCLCLASATASAQTACFATWSSTQIYTGGMTASLNGVNYTAAFWTLGDNPSLKNGPPGSGMPWASNGPCGSGSPPPTPSPTPKSTPTPTPKPTPSPTPTTTPTPTTGGTCAPAWQIGIPITTGEILSFNGHNWKALIPENQTVDGWQPPNVPALWSDQGSCTTGPPPSPTPTPKATPTPTPGPTPKTGPLPKHLLTGYWQNFTNPAQCLKLSAVPTTYDIVAVAFANATGTPGAVSYTTDSGLSSCLGGYTDAQFMADVATLHSRGQKVIVSVGGQNGAISVADSASAANFANSVHGIMAQFGFDGVDIDLENGVDPTNMASALEQLSSMSPGLIITMAPQTIDMQSTGMAYFQLALKISNILTIVNMQYYNSGTMLGFDQKVYSEGSEDFETALATIQLENGLRPDQVGLGLPATGGAAGGGFVSPSVVDSALDCLALGTNCGSFKAPRTYPSIRGAMTWSINWDATNGFSFANTLRPTLNSLP